jgi:hypothetical protein
MKKAIVFWTVEQCILVETDRRFRGADCPITRFFALGLLISQMMEAVSI